jgi:hypothetical protein
VGVTHSKPGTTNNVKTVLYPPPTATWGKNVKVLEGPDWPEPAMVIAGASAAPDKILIDANTIAITVHSIMNLMAMGRNKYFIEIPPIAVFTFIKGAKIIMMPEAYQIPEAS